MKNDIARSLTIEQLKQQYNLDQKSIVKAVEMEKSQINKVENELTNFANATTESIRNLQDQVDGNITTWFFDGIPTLLNKPAVDWTTDIEKNNHLGDLYYDGNTGYAYRFAFENDVFVWKKITDTDVTQALALAHAAKDTADNKRRVFMTQPSPPYDNGDLWIKNNEIYICQISKESGTFETNDFINCLKYTDDTKANEVDGKLTVVAGRVTTVEQGVGQISQQVEENKYFVDGEGHRQLISQSMTQVVQDIDSIEEEIRHIELKVLYTWIKYADDDHGTGMSSSPIGKPYIGIASNKESQTASDNPNDYSWSLIKGADGQQGPQGEKGATGETGPKGDKGDTGATGPQGIQGEQGIQGPKGDTGSQGPQGETGPQGPQGIQGPKGDNGESYYTWIKYADTPTSGMSDNPTGKNYIGIAYNKSSSTESSSYSDYSWSLIKGADGAKGDTGEQGPKGDTGETGPQGATGATGNGISNIKYYYARSTTQTPPAASSITSTTMPTLDSTNKYLWQKEVITYTATSTPQTTVLLIAVYGDTGQQGIQGPQGQQGPQGLDGKDAAIQSPVAPEDTTLLWFDITTYQLKYYDDNLDEWVISNDFSDDINNINVRFDNYYTGEQVNELIRNAETGLTNTFTNTGGLNLLRNTAPYFMESNNVAEYWQGNVKQGKEEDSTSGFSLLLQNGTISQNVKLKNSTYTLSFKWKRLVNLATLVVKYNGKTFTAPSNSNSGYFTSTGDVSDSLIFEAICNTNDGFEIYDLMLNFGDVAIPWSQNANESTSDTVNISKGITVSSNTTNTVATMKSDGFKVRNKTTDEEVMSATDTGGLFKDITSTGKSKLSGLIIQQINDEIWITGGAN